MSFILDALKKSEQEREQKIPVPQAVRKRKLSFRSRRAGSRFFWLSIICFVFVLLSLLFIYIANDEAMETGTTVVEMRPTNTLHESERAIVEASSPGGFVEPAPVPRPFASRESVENNELFNLEASLPVEVNLRSEEEKYGSSDGLEPKNSPEINVLPQEPFVVKVPTYKELSRELRERIPRLQLSMHFFTEVPGRRLVRINNQLLHEGDILSDDLAVLEITPEGAILDFVGKTFVLQSERY